MMNVAQLVVRRFALMLSHAFDELAGWTTLWQLGHVNKILKREHKSIAHIN